MKKLIILAVGLLLLMGCITIQSKAPEPLMCPPQDVLIGVPLAPGMNIPVIIPKGMLNPENQNEYWITPEDYDSLPEDPEDGLSINPKNRKLEVKNTTPEEEDRG